MPYTRPLVKYRWTKLKRWTRFQTITLFRVNDGSERVARGFAIGALINFFPTFGFGIVASGFLAGVLKGNIIAGFVGGTLFVVLWPLIFLLNMKVGSLIYHSPVPVDSIEDVDENTIDALVKGKTFLVGATVNCIVASLLIYALVYFIHTRFRGRILAWLNKLRVRRVKRHLARKHDANQRNKPPKD